MDVSREKNVNRFLSITLHITQVPVDQRPQYKSIYTEYDRRESETSLEYIGPGGYFLNIIPVAQTLRLTINKWDLLKLRGLYKQSISPIKQMVAYRLVKDLHQPPI